MSTYVPATECAKVARAILKEKFPETKFSVKTRRGTGTLDVTWTDGPTHRAVEDATGSLVGEYVDLHQDIVLPTGAVPVVAFEGTARKLMAEFAKGDEYVRLGSGFVFVSRDYSRAAWDVAEAAILKHEPKALIKRNTDGAIAYEYIGGEVWMPDATGDRALHGVAWSEIALYYLKGVTL